MASEVDGLREEVADLRSELSNLPSEVGPFDSLTGVDFKNAGDIKVRVNEMTEKWKVQTTPKIDRIEDLAILLVELDVWLFAPEEESAANAIIRKELDLLRALIKSEVVRLSEAAIVAPHGKLAAEDMAQINLILALYAAPSNEAEREELEEITDNILSTFRRVEEIRYLRYNGWAIGEIEDGLKRYRNVLEISGIQDLMKLVSTDREKLFDAAIATMSKIDTAFLNPATLDLYHYTYTLYREAVAIDDHWRAKLAKGFANPATKRRTPADH